MTDQPFSVKIIDNGNCYRMSDIMIPVIVSVPLQKYDQRLATQEEIEKDKLEKEEMIKQITEAWYKSSK